MGSLLRGLAIHYLQFGAKSTTRTSLPLRCCVAYTSTLGTINISHQLLRRPAILPKSNTRMALGITEKGRRSVGSTTFTPDTTCVRYSPLAGSQGQPSS